MIRRVRGRFAYQAWAPRVYDVPMGDVEPAQTSPRAGALPRVIGQRYQVVEELGRGATGVVYRVEDRRDGTQLALKQLLGSCSHFGSVMHLQFEREFQMLSEVRHPSIIDVYEYGISDQGPFYTMELLSGQSLRGRAPFDVDSTCRCLRDVASGLALLHARRVVHRDVGPSNVHLVQSGGAKLIDFGALCPFGIAESVIGTPPYVAPEVLRRAPLDGRTDLFALGALGYWMLADGHAYPARRLTELPLYWGAEVPRLSELRDDVPRKLEELLSALMSLDAAGRPSSAADVIGALTGIGGLAPEPWEAPSAYIAVPSLVGRARELNVLRKALSRLERGKGGAYRLSGVEGSGKSRLLEELSLHAQLRGKLALTARAEQTTAAFHAARKLADRALEMVPDELSMAAGPRLAVIGHALPQLALSLDGPGLCPIGENLQEWTVRLQSELTSMWLDLAQRCGGLVLLLDDLENADDASVSMLTSIASVTRTYPVMLVVSQRSGDIQKRSELRALQNLSRRVGLRPLDAGAVQALADSLFGDAPNRDRLSRWLDERGDATPLHCIELVRLLIQRGDIRYVNGAWALPQELPEAALPGNLAAACRSRLFTLAPEAYALAEKLSFLPRFSLDTALSVSGVSPKCTIAALDTLTAEGVLQIAGGEYEFALRADREVLRHELGQERQCALRLQLGRLRARDVGAGTRPETMLEIGGHLVAGGDVAAGANLLVRGAEALLHLGGAVGQAAPALELAYQYYRDAEPEDPNQLRTILSLLAVAGYMVDRRYAEHYGDGAFELLLQETGLSLTARLGRIVGGKVALPLGALAAFGQQLLRASGDAAQARAEFEDSYRQLVMVVIALGGVASLTVDRTALSRIIAGIEPLGHLPENQVGSLLHRYCSYLLATLRGQESLAHRLGRRILDQFDDPALFPELKGETRESWKGGLLLGYGIQACYRANDSALGVADQLEAQGFSLHSMFADQVCMLYHANRGELRLARTFRKRVERYAVQGGTTWQAELVLPASLIMPFHQSGEVAGLRRVSEQLGQLSKHLPGLGIYREVALSLLSDVLGESEVARRALERVVPQFPVHGRPGWAPIRGALASVLVDCGEPELARDLCASTLRNVSPEDRSFVLQYHVVERAWVRASLAMGDHAPARRRLLRLIDESQPGNTPLATGLAHAQAVELELAAGNAEAAVRHLETTRRLFRVTACPALIARGERLARMLAEHGRVALDDERTALLSGCTSHRAFAIRVLELLAADTGASQGRLYIQRATGSPLEVALGRGASSESEPDHLTKIASEILASARSMMEMTVSQTATATSGQGAAGLLPLTEVRAVVLASDGANGRQVAGTALLWNDDNEMPRAPNARLVERLSRELRLLLRG